MYLYGSMATAKASKYWLSRLISNAFSSIEESMEKLKDKSLPNSKFVSTFDLSLPFALAPTSRLNESKKLDILSTTKLFSLENSLAAVKSSSGETSISSSSRYVSDL